MQTSPQETREGIRERIEEFVEYTDIHILVMLPPLIGMGGLFIWVWLFHKLTGENMAPPLNSISVGIASLITSLAGLAEIIKREMSGPLWSTVKGKPAVLSGILLLLMFGGAGIFLIISALLGLK